MNGIKITTYSFHSVSPDSFFFLDHTELAHEHCPVLFFYPTIHTAMLL